MSVEEYKKNVGFIGGLSLLASSIAGPGVLQIPAVFQEAGYGVPTFLFIIIMVLAAFSCLFLLEAMSLFPGNQNFERNIEFTVLVHHFYGKGWYYLMHIVLYGSIQCYNIASIIQAIQAFDVFLVKALGGTCGIYLSAHEGSFGCVTEVGKGNSPFGDSFMLLTFGGIILLLFIIPLCNMDLNDNMFIQWLSCAYLIVVVVIWCIMSFFSGRALTTSFWAPSSYSKLDDPMQLRKGSYQNVVGAVLFNYTLANTIPSWVNVKHKSISIQKTVWVACIASTFAYLFTGWFGAAGFYIQDGSNLMSAVSLSLGATYPNATINSSGDPIINFIPVHPGWKSVVDIINGTYPFLILVTSIPVAFVIVKLNLVSSHLCSNSVATFWSIFFPFLVVIPLQTGDMITVFANWTSIIFQSLCNFIAPFMIYIYLHKRNLVMQQSVIDELDNLDVMATIKKNNENDDDDFDYIYHLAHADLSRLPKRDPFAIPIVVKGPGLPQIKTGSELSCAESTPSNKEKKARKRALALSGEPDTLTTKLMRHRLQRGSLQAEGLGFEHNSERGGGSRMDLKHGVSGDLGSTLGSNFAINVTHSPNRRGSYMSHTNQDPMDRRVSAASLSGRGKIYPGSECDGFSVMSYTTSQMLLSQGSSMMSEDLLNMEPGFRALPEWASKRVHPKIVAWTCLIVMGLASVGVFIINLIDVSNKSHCNLDTLNTYHRADPFEYPSAYIMNCI